MRIVLDTNCLLVAIPKKSKYRWLWDEFRKQNITLCYSNEILHEYHELLNSFYSQTVAENVIAEILRSPNTEQIDIFYKWNLIIADPDDNKFVDCAISANAKYIVSNDRHFEVLDNIDFPKVNVVNIQNFAKKLTK